MITLNLSNNQIGNERAQYLADALQQNKVILYILVIINQRDYYHFMIFSLIHCNKNKTFFFSVNMIKFSRKI